MPEREIVRGPGVGEYLSGKRITPEVISRAGDWLSKGRSRLPGTAIKLLLLKAS